MFKTCLETICHSLDGAVLATVMGFDGLPVEIVTKDEEPAGEDGRPVDAESLLVEFSAMLEQIRGSTRVFSAGGLEELAIRSEHLTTVIRLVTKEYFIALAMRPEASVGKGRYLLRLHAPSLVDELS